jgi:MarR family transcriptional regulator, transcriptional regulator for hemolysin
MADPAGSSVFMVVDLARLIRRAFEAKVAQAGLEITAGEARTLLYLSRLPEARQTELAELMRVEPMTLTGYLDRLEARGLVERRPCPADRRAKRLAIAPAAEPLTEEVRRLALAVRRRAMAGLTKAEERAMHRGLARMVENLDERAEEGRA